MKTPLRFLRRMVVFAAAIFLASGCCDRRSGTLEHFGGLAYFSLPWQASVRQPSGMSPEALQADLQDALDRVNRSLSTYQDDSELMRFNRAALNREIPASPVLWRSLQVAAEVSAASGGVYDVTVGPLVNLWGFGPTSVPAHIPANADIDAARSRVDWRGIALADRNMLIRRKDVTADLSSLGEGAGVDALSERLWKQGVRDYLVSVAGTLRIAGRKPDGTLWAVAIERPDGSGQPWRILHLQGQIAVSTSGSYRNTRVIDGMTFSHTLDPRTGRPVTHAGISVTVVMPDSSATRADAWATALNALGPDAGYALAERRHLAACFLVRTPSGFSPRFTSAFRRFLP